MLTGTAKIKDFNSLNERLQQTENLYMIFLSLIIGAIAGFGAVGIRMLIQEVSDISFPGGRNLLDNIKELPWYFRIMAPAIGGLIVGPMIYFLAPEAKGHGVPEVMAAMINKGGRIRPRVALVKAVASSITIGTGGSVGREGPIIQIGASIGSTIGQVLKMPSRRLKTLVGCGAAAGIAAAFNAPIAGILFALELLLMDFSAANLIPIAISSVVSTSISRNIEGDYAAFLVPSYTLTSSYELIFYGVLGILAGLVSFAFIKTLYYSETLFDDKFKIPGYIKPVIGGILLGVVALFFPETLGMGYDGMNIALHGKMLILTSLILIFAKILATSVTLGSGSSGGIFAPSLFMGAMLGSLFGGIIDVWFPDITSGPGAYALVAMAGLVAGTTRATITAIIIVFEMTADYHIILPLVIVCVISTYISSKLSRESIYTLKLVLRNIKVKEGEDSNVLESLHVRDIFKKESDYVESDSNAEKVIEKAVSSGDSVIPVVGSDGRLEGIITLSNMMYLLNDREMLNELIIARDIMHTNVEPVVPSDNCHSAVEIMRRFNIDGLPVVNNHVENKLIGMIWSGDIHSKYLKEIERIELVSKLSTSIQMKTPESQVTFQSGFIVAEIEIPESFAGKNIYELDIRNKFGVDILAVKTAENGKEKFIALPKADYVFREGDRINVAGSIRNINLMKNT